MTIFAKNINAAQRQWLKRYESETGFEPMYQEDLDAETMSFAEVARRNAKWYEQHTNDAYLRITSYIPGIWEELK